MQPFRLVARVVARSLAELHSFGRSADVLLLEEAASQTREYWANWAVGSEGSGTGGHFDLAAAGILTFRAEVRMGACCHIVKAEERKPMRRRSRWSYHHGGVMCVSCKQGDGLPLVSARDTLAVAVLVHPSGLDAVEKYVQQHWKQAKLAVPLAERHVPSMTEVDELIAHFRDTYVTGSNEHLVTDFNLMHESLLLIPPGGYYHFVVNVHVSRLLRRVSWSPMCRRVVVNACRA